MGPYTPASYLNAVTNQIILGCQNFANMRAFPEPFDMFKFRHRKWIMSKCPASLFIFLKEGEINYPSKGERPIFFILFVPHIKFISSVLFHRFFVGKYREWLLLNRISHIFYNACNHFFI